MFFLQGAGSKKFEMSWSHFSPPEKQCYFFLKPSESISVASDGCQCHTHSWKQTVSHCLMLCFKMEKKCILTTPLAVMTARHDLTQRPAPAFQLTTWLSAVTCLKSRRCRKPLRRSRRWVETSLTLSMQLESTGELRPPLVLSSQSSIYLFILCCK